MRNRQYHCDCGESDCNICNPPTPPVERPTIGRLVHFVQRGSGAHRAAMVTLVNLTGTVSLLVFNPHTQSTREHFVSPGVDEGTWHWPERESA